MIKFLNQVSDVFCSVCFDDLLVSSIIFIFLVCDENVNPWLALLVDFFSINSLLGIQFGIVCNARVDDGNSHVR